MIASLARRILTIVLLSVSATVTAFPDKPVRIIVPFSAGTINDVLAREFGALFTVLAKQSVVVDNRTGAEGLIGVQALLSSEPDGYTIMLSSGSLTILDPLMKKSLPYDTQRDLVPLCSVASVEQVLYLSSAQPFKTVAEFIAAAKAQPGKYTYAYASAFGRMNGELFQQATGVKLTSVPYRSTATGLTDVAAGRVDVFFVDHVSAAPHADAGKIRPLTVAGSKPFSFLPGIPPAAAVGVPGFDTAPTFSLYASSKVPKPTIDRLRELLAQVIKSDAWAAVIAKRQLGEFALCGDELVRYHAKEVQRFRTVILDAGIEPQ